jgi:acid phosphatase (class A)
MKFFEAVLIGLLALAACQTPARGQTPAQSAAQTEPPIEARLFVPPPPAPGGPGEAAERAAVRTSWSDARLTQAREDDALDPFAAFDSVLGAGFRADRLPQTAALLTRVTRAAGYASGPPKDLHRRARPFAVDPRLPTCITPSAALRASHSYPSGHASIGWAWALVLAELEPAFADSLFVRGRDFGDSRVVCGLHWPSDVEAGRLIGAAAVARLHADGTFVTQLQTARVELDAVISAPR